MDGSPAEHGEVPLAHPCGAGSSFQHPYLVPFEVELVECHGKGAAGIGRFVFGPDLGAAERPVSMRVVPGDGDAVDIHGGGAWRIIIHTPKVCAETIR